MLGTYLLTVARLLCSIDLETIMFMESVKMMAPSPESNIPVSAASVDEVEERDRMLQRELRLDSIHLATQVIASGLSFISDALENGCSSCGEHIKNSLVQETVLLSQLIRVLKGRDASTRKLLNPSIACSAAINCSDARVKDIMLDARVKDIMRFSLQLLGNLVHRCFNAQVTN